MWSGGCNILEEPGKKFEQIHILENEYEDTSKSRISFMEILGNSNNKGEINEKNKIFISILLCLCLCACTKKADKVERGGYDLTYKTGYYASEINEDNNALYVIYLYNGVGDNMGWGGEDDDIIPNKYAIDNDLQGRYLDTFWDENGNPLGFNLKTTELDKFNVDIYDIKTGEKLKTIDVKSIFDNDDNIKPDRPYKAMALEYDGIPYIMVRSEKTSKDIENGYEDKGKAVFINIEDETYFEIMLP